MSSVDVHGVICALRRCLRRAAQKASACCSVSKNSNVFLYWLCLIFILLLFMFSRPQRLRTGFSARRAIVYRFPCSVCYGRRRDGSGVYAVKLLHHALAPSIVFLAFFTIGIGAVPPRKEKGIDKQRTPILKRSPVGILPCIKY